MRDLSKAKQVIKETDNLVGFKYFGYGCCCAIGALTLNTKNQEAINILEKNNGDRFDLDVVDDFRKVADCLEKEYSLSTEELEQIQSINDFPDEEGELEEEDDLCSFRKDKVLEYLDKLELSSLHD